LVFVRLQAVKTAVDLAEAANPSDFIDRVTAIEG